jgi:hypothetical protein
MTNRLEMKEERKEREEKENGRRSVLPLSLSLNRRLREMAILPKGQSHAHCECWIPVR